ncbi:hypothetical protein DFH08DRAFT_1084684 [Mycena albidolilacea]|uniref:Uncharacterized protein n=1 Tax=Mycena albidolilacea TaxID=1033008 RepID=A0AAD6ZKW4_9AGAR|nr:hypothetical protein DFH08DRAFT_1084684 [Mycena albidolilacea]
MKRIMTLCAAPPPSEPTPSRAAQRRQRVLELEDEHRSRLEDAQALKLTDEQRLSLFLSFWSVKLEWSDLNGMRSVRWCCNSSRPASPPLSSAAPLTCTRKPISTPARGTQSTRPHSRFRRTPMCTLKAFALLTKAHLVSFGKDNIISSAPTPTLTYTSTLSLPTPPGMPPTVWSVSSLPAPVRMSPASGGKQVEREGEGAESLKRLFPFSLSSASSASAPQTTTPCPMRVSLPQLVSVDGDAPEEDDEDAWVDADDDDYDDDEGGGEDEEYQDHAEDGDGELPTPVPWRSELLAPHTLPVLSVDGHVCAPPTYHESEGGRSCRRGTGEGEGRRAGGRAAEAVTTTSLTTATYGTTRRLLSRCPRLSLSRNTVPILIRSLVTTAHDPYLLSLLYLSSLSFGI